MPEAPARVKDDSQLHEVVHRSPLALALLDLDSMQVTDANAAALALLGRDKPLSGPLPLRDVLVSEQTGAAGRALQLVADGTIHSYNAARRLRRADGATVPGHIWVRALPSPEKGVALAVFVPEPERVVVLDDDGVTLEPARRFTLDAPVVVGSMDAGTRIAQLSSDAQRVLGVEPDALLGEALVDLVHPDDVGAFLSAIGHAVSQGTGVGVSVRVQRRVGHYVPVQIVLTPMSAGDAERIGFVVAPETPGRKRKGQEGSDDRVAKLEQHLWRIASEVQAAGVVDSLHRLPDHDDMPGLANLSTRQWHVLSALMRGERVPDIARSMCVSQSTVRNHLSKIFSALGVHSQSELLGLLREHNRRNV